MTDRARSGVRGGWVVGLLLAGLSSLGAGCAGMSNTEKGLVGGGGVGALAGAAIGSASGRPGAGAAIGGLVGAAAGGLTGAAIDSSERRQDARAAREAAARQTMGLQEVVQLTASGASDAIIINQIRTSGTVYHLSPEEIQYLLQNHVREPVIREMQATAACRRPRPVVYTREPYPVVQPVYVVHPPPPPPPVFGIGFTYRRR